MMELRVVPDPMVTPSSQRVFGFPLHVLQEVSDVMSRVGAGMITLAEARAELGL